MPTSIPEDISVPDSVAAAGAEATERAYEQACRSIAPAWPLDRAIAVNPHWARIGQPVRQVAARMAVLGGLQVFPPRALQQQAWASGRITGADLDQALASVPDAQSAGLTADACVRELGAEPRIARLPLLIDLLDPDPEGRTRLSWRQALTHQVSQTCAAYFDQHQADWQPARTSGLYGFWRDTLQHDHGIGILMGLPGIGRALGSLPASRQEAERWATTRLGLPHAVWADYLEAVLLTVNGWASWCAYLGWQARLAGADDEHVRELLAARLAWGAVLLESQDHEASQRAFEALHAAWRHAPSRIASAANALVVDEVWQAALEAGYQRQTARRLAAQTASVPPGAQPIEVQAAFCIDVRSEPMRRALEAVWPSVHTIGAAGFFGLPIAYTPLATTARRPQLPGLLAPALEVTDHIVPVGASDAEDVAAREAAVQDRRLRFGLADQWDGVSRWPGAAFSFVEAAGLGYLGALGNWLRATPAARARDDQYGLTPHARALSRPRLTGLDLDARVSLAERVLQALGLDGPFAPLVLLVGHGSQSVNNAHAAALDCGACCGQTGEVNARGLAALLNEPEVRTALQAHGLPVPDDTWFVAALHNTTTDEVEAFDLDLLPAAARARWDRLQAVLAQAGDQVRRERAPRLGLDPAAPHDALLGSLKRRASDGAQTRPEWGLAGNALFVIAPRWRTRGVVLDGRSFLHDYDPGADADGRLLEQLMTAPMLVTHWINWQYHASTCDPVHLGSGNKLLHNVVGGNIGVFEGNGGDLRVGLSRQSLHDGERWVHEPLRLTVVIDAPAQAVERVLAAHQVVRQLVEHGWLHLWRFDPSGLQRYDAGTWTAAVPGDAD